MMNGIIENVRLIGPMFAAAWLLTIVSVLWRPQRFLNSLLLMFALLVSLFFLTGFFPEGARVNALMAIFLLVMLALFLVPVLLILNGVHMIRQESLSPAHVLSLALGIFVGVGEIAAAVYVFDLSGYVSLSGADLWLMLILFTVFYFSFLVLSFVVYTLFFRILPHRMDFDYVIIHGCGLADGERMTPLLTRRVDRAVEVYQKCRVKPVLIPSGGRGADEKLSEAEAMTAYLLSRGIPEDHILPEDRSATTKENLINSKAIIDGREGRKRIALVSSSYHIYRCLLLARSLKLRCTGIGSKVAPYYWPSAIIREFIAVFLTRRFLIWSLIGYLLFISPILFGLMK